MLYYEISGLGTTPLVLLHGFMENSSIWQEMEVHLSSKFQLIKIDLPGHGKSPTYSEIHTMKLMAEKVKEVINHLGVKKIHILGHSMGGYVALAFAEYWSEYLESITLFFSTYFPDDEEKKEMRSKSLRIIRESLNTFVNAGIPNLFSINERENLQNQINLAKEIALSTNPEGIVAATKGMIERTNKREILEKFNGKILILAGKHDSAIKVEATIYELPKRENIRSYVLDCGHNGHWEKTEICAAVINTELCEIYNHK